MVIVRILGSLEVERDGELVEVAGPRARAALALLVLEANRVVSTERLVDALWGERPPPTAAAAFRNVVAQLRRALGAETIETRAPGYRLNLPPESLDLARFERLVGAAAGAPAADRAAHLREALELWRGPPLPELEYEPALMSELRRISELQTGAQEELVEAELELGLHERVVPRLETLVARHPHRERLRGQLMLALYRSGRQAEALQAYQDARRALADELGLEPGPALRKLHGAILRQEAGLDGSTRTDARGADHVAEVVEALLGGRLVVVLSAEADIAAPLAARFRYPPGDVLETPRVSQYAAVLRGVGPLHDEVRSLAADGEPSGVHRFLASLPPLLRARGLPHQLLVTTDYGGALERAFAEAGEEVDIVSYLGAGPDRGMFRHVAPDGTARSIAAPAEYAAELSLERRTIVLRIRGGAEERFVVTEDDHLEFLQQTDFAARVPVAVAATLRRSHLLFLGYAIRDWSLRLVLARICTELPLAYRSWAVTADPAPIEPELWRRLGVDVIGAEVDAYAGVLAATLAVEEEAVV